MLCRSLFSLTRSGRYCLLDSRLEVAGVQFQISSYSCRKTDPFILAHTIYEPPNPSEDGLDSPVLIAHGLLGSKQSWTSIVKVMGNSINKKIITTDARNHGNSPHSKEFSYLHMANDILNLVQHLRIDKFTLMGHSMGGRSAMAFALKYPHKVERLVSVDISHLEVIADLPTVKIYTLALRELEIKYGGSKAPLSEVRKASDTALKAVAPDPAVRAFLLTNLARRDGEIVFKSNLQVILDNFEDITKFPLELMEETFEGPTLFIRGQKSLYIPLTDFPRIKKMFVNAKLATIEDAGHWLHLENTIQFMEILLPFVQGKGSVEM